MMIIGTHTSFLYDKGWQSISRFMVHRMLKF